MPVPTWDCPELVLLDEPVDVTTVVSEDIWKKFDLDFPHAFSADRYYGTIEDGVIHENGYNGGSSSSSAIGIANGFGFGEGRTNPASMMSTSPSSFTNYEKSFIGSPLSTTSSGLDAREIRHHDCMWAGLCISKEHNRTHPAKKDIQINSKSKIPAGRSLLINRKQQQQQQQMQTTTTTTSTRMMKNLESDGDSTRPETPQSCESETEEDSEDEVPRFKHDSISINDKLSEYIGSGIITVPVSEVTGQSISCGIRKTTTTNSYKKTGMKNHQTHNNYNHSSKINNNDMENMNNNINNINNNNNNNNNSNNKYVKNDQVSINDKRKDNGNINRTTTTNNTTTVKNGINYSGNTTCTNIVSLGDHCYHLNQTSSSCSKKLEHLGVQTPSDSEEEIDVVTFDKPFRPASLPTNPSLADKKHLQKTVTSALKDKTPPRPRGRPPSNAPKKRSAQTELKPAKRPKSHKSSASTANHQQKRNNNSGALNNNNNNNNDDNNDCKNPLIGNSRVSINNQDYHDNNGSSSSIGSDTRTTTTTTTRNYESKSNVDKNDRLIKNYDNNSKNNDGGGGGGGGTTTGTTTTGTTTSGTNNKWSNNNNNNNNNNQISRSSSDDEPDTEKRSLHNNMERQRRIELRNAFEELRVLVPEVEMKEKAPKVVILRQAAIYCDMLTEIEQNKLATENELRRRQVRLRTKLSQLRRNLRSERRGAQIYNHQSAVAASLH